MYLSLMLYDLPSMTSALPKRAIYSSCDQAYLGPTLHALWSAISHSRAAVDVALITDVSENNELLRRAKKLFAHHSCELQIYAPPEVQFGATKYINRYSSLSYGVLYGPELLHQYDTLTYIDGDTLCVTNIDDIICFDAKRVKTGAVLDYFSIVGSKQSDPNYARIKIPISRYYNTGVVLQNGLHWRNTSILDRCIKASQKTRYELIYPDQDIFNIVLSDEVSGVSPSFNMLPKLETYFSNALMISPAVYHFVGSAKPWSQKLPRVSFSAANAYAESLDIADMKEFVRLQLPSNWFSATVCRTSSVIGSLKASMLNQHLSSLFTDYSNAY